MSDTRERDLTELASGLNNGLMSGQTAAKPFIIGGEVRRNFAGGPGGFDKGIAEVAVAGRNEMAMEGFTAGAVSGNGQTAIAHEPRRSWKSAGGMDFQGHEGAQNIADARETC